MSESRGGAVSMVVIVIAVVVTFVATFLSPPQTRAAEDEQALERAVAETAKANVAAMAERVRAGEPLTLSFIALNCDWMRRACIADLRVAIDPAARVGAAEEYAARTRTFYERLEQAGRDNTSMAHLLSARYYKQEAELWLARVKAGKAPE